MLVCCFFNFWFQKLDQKMYRVICLWFFLAAMNFSFTLASEVLLTLEFMVTSIRMCSRSLSENGKDVCTEFSKEIVPFLCIKLGSYAQNLLMHKSDRDDIDGSSKTKVSTIFLNFEHSGFYLWGIAFSPCWDVWRNENKSIHHCMGKWSRRYSAFTWQIASQLLTRWACPLYFASGALNLWHSFVELSVR